jgi:hypothetical protein
MERETPEGDGRTRGGGRAGRFDARPIVDVDAHPHQPAARARKRTAESAEAAADPEPVGER